MRKVDIGMIINLVTLIGLIWAVYAFPARWDQAAKEVAELKPKVEAHGQQLAAISAQYADIRDELHNINRKLGR